MSGNDKQLFDKKGWSICFMQWNASVASVMCHLTS